MNKWKEYNCKLEEQTLEEGKGLRAACLALAITLGSLGAMSCSTYYPEDNLEYSDIVDTPKDDIKVCTVRGYDFARDTNHINDERFRKIVEENFTKKEQQIILDVYIQEVGSDRAVFGKTVSYGEADYAYVTIDDVEIRKYYNQYTRHLNDNMRKGWSNYDDSELDSGCVTSIDYDTFEGITILHEFCHVYMYSYYGETQGHNSNWLNFFESKLTDYLQNEAKKGHIRGTGKLSVETVINAIMGARTNNYR